METGAALLAERPHCWTKTLDISGDGKHNTGPHPKVVRDRLAQRGLTINASATFAKPISASSHLTSTHM